MRETCPCLTAQRLRFNLTKVGKSQNCVKLWQTLPPRLKHTQVGVWDGVIAVQPAREWAHVMESAPKNARGETVGQNWLNHQVKLYFSCDVGVDALYYSK